MEKDDADFIFRGFYISHTILANTLKDLEEVIGREQIFKSMVNGIKISINSGKIEVRENIEYCANSMIDKIIEGNLDDIGIVTDKAESGGDSGKI